MKLKDIPVFLRSPLVRKETKIIYGTKVVFLDKQTPLTDYHEDAIRKVATTNTFYVYEGHKEGLQFD